MSGRTIYEAPRLAAKPGKEGAWFAPDAAGRDVNGWANVLTEDRAAPSGASTYNTCLVQVEPAGAASPSGPLPEPSFSVAQESAG